jgi:hypothetical protein
MGSWYLNKFRILLFALCLLSTEAAAIESKTFDGIIDFQNKGISFNLDLEEKGRLEVSGGIEGDSYRVKISLRHIKFGKSNLVTDFYAQGIIIRDPTTAKLKCVKGKAWTQNTLLNFKPLKEFLADYEISNSRLTIYALSWADLGFKGYIEKGAYYDLLLTIHEMPLQDLAGLLGVSPDEVELSGVVSGEAGIRGKQDGAADGVKIEAKLTALKGSVSNLKFDSATLNMEGFWPVLRFVDATVIEPEGVAYGLQGKFNLKELSDFNSSEHQVTVCVANNAVRLQDWIIKRRQGSGGRDWIEVEYPIKDHQALKMRFKDQEEIFGWERTVKF